MRPVYTIVDLFAGCGGLTAGFLRASSDLGEFRPIAAVESDLDAAATYDANLGRHVYLGTIEEWLQGAHHPDRADVVLGGPPCQGFSQLGKQEVTDRRNALWEQYVEVVGKLRPKIFVLENVREFLRSEQFGGLEAACRSGNRLEDYEIERFVLDASLYGAPQRRRRAIVVGRRRGYRPLGEPPQSERRSSVRKAFDGLPIEVRDRDLPDRQTKFRGRQVLGPFDGSELHLTRFFTQLSLDRYRSIPPGGNRFDIPYLLQAPAGESTGPAPLM